MGDALSDRSDVWVNVKDLREEVRFVVAPCRRGVSPERLGVGNGTRIYTTPCGSDNLFFNPEIGCPTHKGS